MTTFISFISQPWIGSVLAVLSFGAAFYFYRKSLRRPRLAYQQSKVTIVGGGTAAFPTDLEVRFGGRVVPRVTASTIVLWNAGNETLRGDQIVETDPLRCAISPEEALLQVTILSITRAVNKVSAIQEQEGPNVAEIQFDYLDPGDGATVEVLHTDLDEMTLLGTLRGLPDGPINYASGWRMSALGMRTAVMMIFVLVFSFGIVGVNGFVQDYLPKAESIRAIFTGFLILISAFTFSFFASRWVGRKPYPTPLEPPKGLH